MKQRFLLSLLSLLLLSSYSTTAARLLIPKQELNSDNGLVKTVPITEIDQEDPLNIMGEEYCEKRDEECLKRRMIAEAHLDYIYTQHHKP